jgi:predicted transcriptional regulator YheO
MAELPAWAEVMAPTCQAVADLLYPHGEVVLHDLATDTIVRIWNGFSARQPGDPSLLAEEPIDPADGPVLGPYEKVTLDGRRLTSISSIVRDSDGESRGLLCINLDRSPLDRIVTALTAIATPPVQPRPPALFERDWREQIALAVDDWCRTRGLARDALTRSDRLEIVRVLDEQDLFATRKAATHVATALGISRATVYQLLRVVREGDQVTSNP